MMSHFAASLIVFAAMAMPADADAKVKIATVPAEVSPYSGVKAEAIFVMGYRFELNRESTRARVVIDFGFQNPVGAQDNPHAPSPTYFQIVGLAYDPSAHAVVFTQGDSSTICAEVKDSKGRIGSRAKVKSTGNCLLTSEQTTQLEDNGWNVNRSRRIDLFIETH